MRILILLVEYLLPISMLFGIGYFAVTNTILAPKKINDWITEIKSVNKQEATIDDVLIFFKDKMSEIEAQLEEPQVITLFNIYKNLNDVIHSYHERGKKIDANYELLIKKIVLDMIPKTLEQYLTLPKDFAQEHKNNEGKTAKDIFIESLDMLDKSVEEIKIDLLEDNLKDLKANYNYLNSKLG